MGWVPLVWLVVALALAGTEVLTGDLFLLMISGGALAAAGADFLFDRLWIDGAVFAIVSLLLLLMVRPRLLRRFAGDAGLPEPARALEGRSAVVLDAIARHSGLVKLDGEVWTARPLNDVDVFAPGDHVTVMRIDGATAIVYREM